ncbi:MAG: FtsW/RodA/SpoVE family cell cycle protein, partial [Clostridia bacterium]|nr:FtsW/RodA/SpoVE family cell cycle protein [Clostridia bacterium]
ATRWLELPGIPQFQPSELAKVGLVFCFAGYTSWIRRRKERPRSRADSPAGRFFRDGFIQFIIPGIAIMVWILLIVTQPHLSCAIIMACLAGCCYFAAGFSTRVWLAGLSILLVVVLLVVMVFAFVILPLLPDDYLDQYDYWARRINVFTDSDEASDDDRHQNDQSRIAIGSGGLTGVGLGQGRQKFNYLPEEFNDYVFAILAEELGLVGSLSVILLFLALLLMGTATALRMSAAFPAILVFGYTCLIAMQAFLNIGVAAGVLPPTGISLPLFSYGGTSNLFFLLGAGLLLGASRNAPAQPREQRRRMTDA